MIRLCSFSFPYQYQHPYYSVSAPPIFSLDFTVLRSARLWPMSFHIAISFKSRNPQVMPYFKEDVPLDNFDLQ